MSKKIVSEGKTSTEAIQNGLKQLNVSKDMVEIKILENEEKKSFFSILTPRIVKVELTLKEEKTSDKIESKQKNNDISQEDINKVRKKLEDFLKEFLPKLSGNIKYEIIVENFIINVKMSGEDVNYLIGYRGEVLNAFQVIISSVVNNGLENRCKINLDIEGYRKKREKVLEELAEKISKTVIRTNKSITLEPMSAYERKIIHNKLQNHDKIKTYSTGEEPYRKIVITLK